MYTIDTNKEMYTFKQSNNARVHNLINLYFVISSENEIGKDQKAYIS